MRISVITPFRNVEPFLHRCISSLLSQTYPEDRYEIIMVDNDSTDRSAAIAASHPRVRLLSESRPGAYAARNLAVRFATGDVMAFIDASCVAAADWLERIAAAMRIPGFAVIQGRRDFANDSPALAALSVYEAEKARFVFSRDDRRAYYACMASLAARKSVLEEIGSFLEIPRGADVVFLQRVIARYGCGAAHYASDVRVRDLEVRHVTGWYRKLFVYGRSYSNYRKLVSVRPLGVMERARVYRSAMQGARFSLPRAALSLPILVGGALSYDLGRCLPLHQR